MKTILIATLLVCFISVQGVAQNNNSTIYDSLLFENGMAIKKVAVDYKCLGKSPTATTSTNDSLIAAINNAIKLHSETAMEFYHNNKNYYVNLHDKCLRKAVMLNARKTNSHDKSINIMITIVFFENVYYRGNPYAVIIDIKKFSSYNKVDMSSDN